MPPSSEPNLDLPRLNFEERDNSSSEEQEDSEIDKVLANGKNKQSREEVLLTFKVNELQKICKTLSEAN